MTVIGYKGTSEERGQNWLTMLMVKGYLDLPKSNLNEFEEKVVERDKRVYGNYLSDYIKD